MNSEFIALDDVRRAHDAVPAFRSGDNGSERTPPSPYEHIWAKHASPLLATSYIVKGLIGEGSLVVLWGPPKSGKTFLALDLALSVAVGTPWFGLRVRPSTVVYIASEMGDGVQRRVCAWTRHHHANLSREPSAAFITTAVNVLEEADVQKLCATLNAIMLRREGPFLVVFDTLARSMVGGDENSAGDMGRAVAAADMLRDRYKAATLVVHHAGKDTSKGARGSSALVAAADTVVAVDSPRLGEHRAIVQCSRDGAAGQRFLFRLPVISLGDDEDGDPVHTCVVEPRNEAAPSRPAGRQPADTDLVLRALRVAIASDSNLMHDKAADDREVQATTTERWRKQYLDLAVDDETARQRSPEAIRKRFGRGRQALIASGYVRCEQGFCWLNEGPSRTR